MSLGVCVCVCVCGLYSVDESFAGPMSLMANIKLYLGRDRGLSWPSLSECVCVSV